MLNFLKGLFGRKRSRPPESAVTAELDQEQLWQITRQRPGQSLQTFRVGTGLDVGRRRENNEDALLAIHATLGVESGSQPLGIFAVADGMGGHRSGEIASENAVRSLGNYLMQKVYEPLLGPNPHPAEDSLREIMEAGILHAHNVVKRKAPGGGCTLTAALVVGNQMAVGHLGDSRAYAVESDGRITALTTDHTLVNRLQEMGKITAEEAASHPQKSVLYRALGQGDPVQAEIATSTLSASGALLLCSDGLWGLVSEEDIEQIINAAATPELACQHLVEAANQAGGADNIAVVLVRLSQ